MEDQPLPPGDDAPEGASIYDVLHAAATHHQAGRLAQAEALYRAVLARHPDNRDANHNLGVLAMQSGVPVERALVHFHTAWEADPSHAQHGLSYLRALVLAGDIGAARRLHEEGLRRGFPWPGIEALRSPRAAPAPGLDWRTAVANAMRQGRVQEALDAAVAAARRLPNDPEPHAVLGALLIDAHRFTDAEAAFRHAIAMRDAWPQALCGLGRALAAQERLDDAGAAFRQALAIEPGHAEAHARLGEMLVRQKRLPEAEAHCREALVRNPGAFDAHRDLGAILMAQARLAEAEASYRRALALRPDDLATRSTLVYLMHYAATQQPEALFAEASAYGVLAAAQARPFTTWPCEREPQRLRVGLVSGDLGEHPVGYFLERVVAASALGAIEWIAYPSYAETDELTARLRKSFSGWKPIVGLTDEEAARRIREDGVHILVDLAGHSVNNRLALFAWRPAPVQASWLGYFATTGLAAMDFLLADEVGVPPSQQRWFTEAIRYLPDTRLCFSPPENAPAVTPLPAIANGFVTFGCFQDLPKITDGALGAWARVLAACPGSRLRVQNDSLRDSRMADAFKARLAARGVDPSRVDLHARVPRNAYLTAHAEVDLILDTFPFPGGTTTCEALWMGVPSVTLAGQSMIARQGASLLTAAGLACWVSDSIDDYVARAVAQASDVAGLDELRRALREQVRAAPLFDAGRFARHLEQALRAMWDESGRARVAG